MTERPQPQNQGDFFTRPRKWVRDAMPKTPEIPGKAQILVVQARTNPIRIQQEQERLTQLAAPHEVSLRFINAVTEPDHPWSTPRELLLGISGIIFPGSADVDLTENTPEKTKYLNNVIPLVDLALQRGRDPKDFLHVFAMCLGDQIIHMRANAQIRRNPAQAETGTGKVALTEAGKNHPYLQGIPRTTREDGEEIIDIFLGHKDSKDGLGDGFVLLGSTPKDPYSLSSCERIFSTGGHPEIKDVVELEQIVAISNDHSHLGEGTHLALYIPTYPFEDTPYAGEMLSAFFGTVAAIQPEDQKTTN